MYHKKQQSLKQGWNFIKYFLSRIIKNLLLYSVLMLVPVQNIYAKDTLDTIIDILSSLTCETQGIGDLLRSEFSHTCIPAPFFTFAVANIISPGLYAMTLLRLKINDHELFDKDYPGGQCARFNKVKTPPSSSGKYKLTFALCNNTDLIVARAKAVAESAIAIAKAVFTGKDPWDDIKNAWSDKKASYHRIFKDIEEGHWETMIDIPPIVWKVVKENDRMCVTTPTILADWVAVGCKYIEEPFPESIYSSFMNLNPTSHTSTGATDPMALVNCSMPSSADKGTCYSRAYNNSKTAIVITAPLIECIKEMAARLLISTDVCTIDDVNQIVNAGKKHQSALFQFQRNMHKGVAALLTLYVVLFGAKILLAGNVPPRSEIINFILKIIFVTYFSIGFNVNLSSSGERLDGITQFAFPFLLGGISELAGWIMHAVPSELCKFDPSEYKDNKISYIALWDALDCRVSHYLGLDMLSTLLVENMSRNHDFASFDFFSFSAPPYVYLLIPAIISGYIPLISLALSYPLLVISVGAFMVNATVMCMISIVILGILAPLFVPMFLFEYTRGYFESWVKLLISFLLQPMVVVTFMIMMFSVYDLGFYGHCRYVSKTLDSSIISGGDGVRSVKVFFVDNKWSDYPSEDDVKSCKNSLGYILNNPIAAAFDFTTNDLNKIVKDKPGTGSTDDFLNKFGFLQGIVMGPGMFFTSPKLIFEKIKDIVLALVTACFTLYLMYHFSAQLANFAADMTEGVPLNNVAINPQAIFKAGMAAIAAAGGMQGGGGIEGDKVVTRGGLESDEHAGEGATEEDVFDTDNNVSDGGDSVPDMVVTGVASSPPPATPPASAAPRPTLQVAKIEMAPPVSTPSAVVVSDLPKPQRAEISEIPKVEPPAAPDPVVEKEKPKREEAPVRDKGKAQGLVEMPERAPDDTRLKAGEAGYIAQQKRNIEKNETYDKAHEQRQKELSEEGWRKRNVGKPGYNEVGVADNKSQQDDSSLAQGGKGFVEQQRRNLEKNLESSKEDNKIQKSSSKEEKVTRKDGKQLGGDSNENK